jgi:hypothetical protein
MMALFDKLLFGGLAVLAGVGIKKLIESNEEHKRRVSTPCHFSNGITQSEFALLVNKSAKHIKRLTVHIDGHIVHGIVLSQSKLSSWTFNLDFNDYGKVTGEYWCYSDNRDSLIPNNLGNRVKESLRERIEAEERSAV